MKFVRKPILATAGRRMASSLDKARQVWLRTTAVRSSYRFRKVWLSDALMCECTFPPQRMREGVWGFTCNNDQCRDFVSKADAKTCERVASNAYSVNQYLYSSTMRQLAGAEKTGNYMRAQQRD